MMSPGFHSAAFLVHLSWLCVAIRRAWRHFNFSVFVMLYDSIFSLASFGLLLCLESSLLNRLPGLLCCLHHHPMKYCCLDRIRHHVLSSSQVSSLISSSRLSFSPSFFRLYFLFVWMMSRSILRWVVRSMFLCSFDVAHVPAPFVLVGVTTASNWCNQCRSE